MRSQSPTRWLVVFAERSTRASAALGVLRPQLR